ncbi:DUF6221 family protein [Streptomyces sp. NPDC013457]|uniref:DUF6221 family protein n=1 Tax=Streptomyces sp. NPDC013457 TaxID=3364866 RepID=UPI0036FB0856
MDDLIAFLRARLGKDEQTARAHRQASAHWYYDHMAHEVRDEDNAGTVAFTQDRDGQHIARHDPARVLAEVDAKRRILERHAQCGSGIGRCDDGGHVSEGEACAEQIDLAAPYADHPDYKDKWRP